LSVTVTGAPQGGLGLGQLPDGSAEKLAPTVESTVEVGRCFGDDRLQPGVTEPARIGEGRKVKLKDATDPGTDLVTCRLGKLNGIQGGGAKGELGFVVGVNDFLDGVAQRKRRSRRSRSPGLTTWAVCSRASSAASAAAESR
jgi:hypothetical protein